MEEIDYLELKGSGYFSIYLYSSTHFYLYRGKWESFL